MSSERKYLGGYTFLPVDLSNSPQKPQIEEVKISPKKGLLTPFAFWRKKQVIEEFQLEEEQITVATNIIQFPSQEVIVPESNIIKFPIQVAMAKGVKGPDKIQAKKALEALVEMNKKSSPHEQVEYNIIPFKLREGHKYEVVEYTADEIPMQRQNSNTSGDVKENSDGTVIAYQFVAHKELLLPSSSETNLAMITNRPNSLVKAANETPISTNAISMAVVIEELGANLLPEGTELGQVTNNQTVKPNDFWGNKEPEQLAPQGELHPENITYLDDYKKAVGFPDETGEDQAA